MPSDDELPGIRPRIVEIVGPAATGKTTLFRTMLRHYGDEVVGKPRLRRLPYVPLFAREAVALAPVICSGLPRRGFATLDRFSKMVYLHVLARVLQRGSPWIARVQVLDQGPVHLLAKLRARRPPGLIYPCVEAWEEASLDTWASLLDTVVWLDAPDVFLLERIDARVKPHALKDRSARHALEVLAQARWSSQSVISELSARSAGFAVQRFDTSRESPDEIAGAVAAACGLSPWLEAPPYHERSSS